MCTVATASALSPRWPGLAALAVGAVCAWPAQATIYKCEGPVAGVPLYQDTPCPTGKQLRDFDKDPPTVSVLPLATAPLSGAVPKNALPPPAPPSGKSRNGAKTKVIENGRLRAPKSAACRSGSSAASSSAVGA